MAEPRPVFENPAEPTIVYAYRHDHKWELAVGAKQNPNGTWSSLWRCALCPDIGVGGNVGPIPDGYCACGWVQKNPDAPRCEECKRPLARAAGASTKGDET